MTVRGNRWHPNRDNYTVDVVTGCWNWQGVVTNVGYGITRVNGRATTSHRFHYERMYGPVPEGLELDHLCGNRRCCNPLHLEAVTRRENLRRGRHIKFSLEKACELRRLHAEGHSGRSLAERFGVSRSTAHYIIKGERWAEE